MELKRRFLAVTATCLRSARCLLIATLLTSCGDDDPKLEATPRNLEVLVFTRTEGFRHDSIADARQVFSDLDARERIHTTLTEDTTAFTDAGLAAYDVLVFANTTGDVLDPAEQEALQRFLRSGGGFVGVHAAADTEHDWAWYGDLVGAYIVDHPPLPVEVTVHTEDSAHESTAHLDSSFLFTDEWYNFDRRPREHNHVLLRIDEDEIPGFRNGADHPVAWLKEFDGGRSWYTNLGHRPETWHDPRFMQHLLEGIRWAARPRQWNRVTLTTAPRNPLALEVLKDGRVFYIEITGDLMEWSPATGATRLLGTVAVENSDERGLLGLALDPEFTRNRTLYLYHSEPAVVPGGNTENVLSRYQLHSNGTLDLNSRFDLLRVPSDGGANHEAGDVEIGPDGNFYVSTGDNTNPFASNGYAPLDERAGRAIWNAQRTSGNPFDLRGSILRIRRDGSIPPGNLYPLDGSAGRPEIFAKGTRNPFRIAIDRKTGRLWWGDVGPDALVDGRQGPRGYDELNLADTAGNYGWPYCLADRIPYFDVNFSNGSIGAAFSCDETRPAALAYDYRTFLIPAFGSNETERAGTAGRTMIAGIVYEPAQGAPFALPTDLRGDVLVTEWTRDILASVVVDDAGRMKSVRRLIPWEQLLRPIDVDQGPDGALYVLEFGSGLASDNPDARLSRIEYSESGRLTPAAVISVEPKSGLAPLDVELSGEASRPGRQGDRIVAWEWDVDGDGRYESQGPRLQRRLTANGEVNVTLRVRTERGDVSFPAVERVIVGNREPQLTIIEPRPGTTVNEGDLVRLVGSGTDPEGGEVPCEELVWDIRLGHNAHAHPQSVVSGCENAFVALLGDHGDEGDIYYVVELRHRDGGGPNGEPSLTGRTQLRVNVIPSEEPLGSCSTQERDNLDACASPCSPKPISELVDCVTQSCARVIFRLSIGCQRCAGQAVAELLAQGIPSYAAARDFLIGRCAAN